MIEPFTEIERFQERLGTRVPAVGWQAGIDRGYLDVLLGACGRDQVIGLEDESERAPPQCRKFVGVEAGDPFAVDQVFARGRLV
ncbi:hypothetical protein ABIA26_005854 [Sinorhizobium fredii]